MTHFSYNSILCYLVGFCVGVVVCFFVQRLRRRAAEHEGRGKKIISWRIKYEPKVS
jgi:hypothetical protein